ncbi:MAG: hypothetical protein GX660_18725 [Clostridiaceae bacterium]|nr:hypothetical protein [Clostridiaceae bacterium]
MKYFFIILFYFAFIPLSKAQYSEETNRMLGIAPREPEAKGAPYYSIKSVFDSTTYYTAYFSENQFGDKKHPEPNIKFLFNGLNILTTYPSNDPKSHFRVLGEIDKVTDNEHSYHRLQCVDNSGSYVAIAIGYEFSSNVEMIVFVYGNTTYYFEVKKSSVPKSVLNIINSPIQKDEFLKSLDLPGNSNDIARVFLSQFGTIERVVKQICD